jgi:hypothetical protein
MKTLKNRMRLPLAIAVQIATALLLCGPISATPSCPAQWVQHPGVCLFPRKDQYKNFSVASSPQQEWGSECCSACATDERCASWLLYIEKKGGAPGTSVLCAWCGMCALAAGTCILNTADAHEDAPSASCTSGQRPAATWPPSPPPKPAPKSAKNVRRRSRTRTRSKLRSTHKLRPSCP